MIFTVRMKTPNALDNALDEMMNDELYDDESLDDETSHTEMIYDVANEARSFAEKFMEYGELITIQFDTVAKTAIVLPHDHP